MNTFFTTLLIGISLSMDAFSLALFYGLQPISNKNKIILSLIVGAYHFIMPLLGKSFGNLLSNYIIIDFNIIVSIILTIIGIEMIISTVKETELNIATNILGFLIIGFSVSLDSFTTGIGLDIINKKYTQTAIIFSITSCLFTYIGLNLGNKINNNLGNYSTIIGGIVLIIIALTYIF